ncbi:MAG TPA: TIGR03066 family protein [Gemmataceae bacterium]|nr:TIGR03066 family protein [Gemmataceae bacterium]
MSTLRWLAVGAIACLLVPGARAEDKPDYAKLLVGKWEVSKADEGTVPTGTIIEFTKDGKVTLTGKKDGADVTMDGTYKLEGDKFTVTMKRDDKEQTHTITIKKISEKEMTTENPEGKVVELKKK